MTIAILLGKPLYTSNPAFNAMCGALKGAGHKFEMISDKSDLSGFDLLLSVGGDGTFLNAASIAAPCGVPVLGVNLGRLGFLSENTPADVAKAIVEKRYSVGERSILKVTVDGHDHYALNEAVVSRKGSAMLGVKISLNGREMPACWGDGVLVSTASGSTAYSLSIGGPIVHPAARVLIIAPVAPHNLNVRPLVVPQESRISLKLLSRDDQVKFSWDNNSYYLNSGSILEMAIADFSLKRVVLDSSNFVKALSEKLFWGEDKRNEI